MFLLIFLLFHSIGDAQQEKHDLYFKFTALCKANTFPEFSAEAVADGRQIVHYSNEKRDWILTEDDWTEVPEEPPDSRDWFLHQMKTLSNCAYSKCSELHVLQRIIGCELEKQPDGTVSLRAFDKYGFDGEDFMAFNSDTLQWIDKNPKAKEIKMKWDQQTARSKLLKHYLKTCTDWISTFHNRNKTPPGVHVFARKAPDDHSKLVLTCLATGFYPRDIEMYIRLDRTVLKDQTTSGIKPNNDGSFQMRTSVKIDGNHKGSFDCLVIHSSLTEQVSVKWVQTFDYFKAAFIAGVTGEIVSLVATVTVHCLLKKWLREANCSHYAFPITAASLICQFLSVVFTMIVWWLYLKKWIFGESTDSADVLRSSSTLVGSSLGKTRAALPRWIHVFLGREWRGAARQKAI